MDTGTGIVLGIGAIILVIIPICLLILDLSKIGREKLNQLRIWKLLRLSRKNAKEAIDKPEKIPKFCFACKKEFKGWLGLNRFHCKYCNHYFCGKHRLPERHNCKGKPKQLEGDGYRKIYHRGYTEIKH